MNTVTVCYLTLIQLSSICIPAYHFYRAWKRWWFSNHQVTQPRKKSHPTFPQFLESRNLSWYHTSSSLKPCTKDSYHQQYQPKHHRRHQQQHQQKYNLPKVWTNFASLFVSDMELLFETANQDKIELKSTCFCQTLKSEWWGILRCYMLEEFQQGFS